MHTTSPRIVNIVNFIRGVEPRRAMDLVEPVRHQIELAAEHALPATWLLQYDALIQGPYVEMLKALGPEHEIGGWFEVVQPLVEKAGLTWRGRYPWDWHSHVGFSVGYTPAEREALADVFMADFKATFGRYPASMGSWLMDAHLVGYLHDRYGLVASCNCKDQWGTDGYSLWGGYWNQAYYPSRSNAFMPAQHASQQIPVPTFRMLGSDPVRQYDAEINAGANPDSKAQYVITLEPICPDGGSKPDWVRWFFDSMTQEPCLAFAYTQVGQENSFGWSSMGEGLTDQMSLLAELQKQGAVRVETLEASGRWFRERFPVTPATAVTALEPYRNEGRRSAWFQSRFYRVNLYWHGDQFLVRDIHLFDEDYAERYLTEACTTSTSTYDTLPVAEGFLWSRQNMVSGFMPMRLPADGPAEQLCGGQPTVTEEDPSLLSVAWPVNAGGVFITTCAEDTLSWEWQGGAWRMELHWAEGVDVPFRLVEGTRLLCRHNGFDYAVECRVGTMTLSKRLLEIHPVKGQICLVLSREAG